MRGDGMRSQLFTYALIKTMYDKGGDYLDAFCPFVLKGLKKDSVFQNIAEIQTGIADEFCLRVPQHTVQRILSISKGRGYVEQVERLYRLTNKGISHVERFETDKDVERRLNALLSDILVFLPPGTVETVDQVRSELFSFLQSNLESMFEMCCEYSPSGTQPSSNTSTIVERYLFNYVIEAERVKPDHYATLKDVVLGSIMSSILTSSSYTDLNEVQKRFGSCTVYLDTNLVLNVLGIGETVFTTPAKELYDLLKKYKFRIRVFSFTVDEICKVIRGYIREEHTYPDTVRVDSLYSTLKRMGWKKSDALSFVGNVEQILAENGILVDGAKDINLSNYVADASLRASLTSYKPLQPLSSQNHDLAAIERIRQMRSRRTRKMTDAEVLFVTSDKVLSKFDFVELGHRDAGTVCEVVLDSLLTNILWLKNPCGAISVKSIIGAYSRELFVKRRVWEKFYQTLVEVRKSREIKEDDILDLFTGGFLEDMLRELDESQVSDINDDYVLELIERASERQGDRLARAVEETQNEYESKTQIAVSSINNRWIEMIDQMKDSIRDACKRKATHRAAVVSTVVSMVWIGGILGVYLWAKSKEWADLASLLISLLLGGSGIAGIWLKVRDWCRRHLEDRLFLRQLRESGMGNILAQARSEEENGYRTA